MPLAQNLSVICQESDGAYICTVDIWDDFSQSWDNCNYCARPGDQAPVNLWILQQIATGAYDPIVACPLSPTLDAAFLPKSVVVGSSSTLTWTSNNSTGVELSDDPGVIYPSSGSKSYATSQVGNMQVFVTAKSILGNIRVSKTLYVVATQQELLSEETAGPAVF
jgi:hypothetical protein